MVFNELFVSNIFASIGAVTLYLLIATVIGRIVYKACNGSDADKSFAAVMGGIFFPITIVIGLVLLWIKAICNVKLEADTETSTPYYDSQIEDLRNEVSILRSDCKDATRADELFEEEVVKSEKPKFKVGDLITGVSGNPNNYKVLYTGCLCRVLEINEKSIMRLILVDHIDKEAHKSRIGEYFKAPARNFILYPTKTSSKAKTKKK